MDMVERRRFKRYSLYCPLQFKPETSSREYSISLNICEAGAFISSDKSLVRGESLIVKIILRNEEFFLRSRIVHIQHERIGGPYQIGVEFMETSPSFAQRFYEELAVIMNYQKQFNKESGRELSLAEASMKWYRNAPTWW